MPALPEKILHQRGCGQVTQAIDLTKLRQCATCKYSEQHKTDLKLRICRRYPPTPQLIPGPGGGPVQVNLWPPTAKDDWCGEHEYKLGASDA